MQHEAELRERELLHKHEVDKIKLQMSDVNKEAVKKKQPKPKRMVKYQSAGCIRLFPREKQTICLGGEDF